MRRRELFTCKECEILFKSKSEQSKYCSKKCQRKAANRRQSLYQKEMRDTARDIGNCTYCYKEKKDPRYQMCLKCRTYAREWKKKHWGRRGDEY